MRKINLKSMVRTLVLAIVMLVAGTLLAPQSQASKFRGIIGGHFGLGEDSYFYEYHAGGGGSVSIGIQAAKLFYIGAGVNFSCYENNNFSFFANPRLDLFNISKEWTPYVSGRIGYQVLEEGNIYGGGDIGVRKSVGGSKGISFALGVETIGSWSDYDWWATNIAFVTRLSFEF